MPFKARGSGNYASPCRVFSDFWKHNVFLTFTLNWVSYKMYYAMQCTQSASGQWRRQCWSTWCGQLSGKITSLFPSIILVDATQISQRHSWHKVCRWMPAIASISNPLSRQHRLTMRRTSTDPSLGYKTHRITFLTPDNRRFSYPRQNGIRL